MIGTALTVFLWPHTLLADDNGQVTPNTLGMPNIIVDPNTFHTPSILFTFSDGSMSYGGPVEFQDIAGGGGIFTIVLLTNGAGDPYTGQNLYWSDEVFFLNYSVNPPSLKPELQQSLNNPSKSTLHIRTHSGGLTGVRG